MAHDKPDLKQMFNISRISHFDLVRSKKHFTVKIDFGISPTFVSVKSIFS